MEAPMYRPAASYHAPVVAPCTLTVEGCTIAELLSDPSVWTVVIKHMPAFKFIVAIEDAKPQFGNMTIVDFAHFGGPLDPKVVAALNAELKPLSSTAGRGS